MHKIITLPSDQKPIEIRALGLFELVNIGPELIGPFVVSYLTVTGEVIQQEYDLRNPELKDNPVFLPDNPEPEPGTYEYHQLKRWNIHQAAIAHELKRIDNFEEYQRFVASHILTTCISEPNRITTPEDFEAIYQAALTPQLTEEALQAELDKFFRGFIRWPAFVGNAVPGEWEG